ncbi:MAG: hypothetical protein QOE70_6710 [Chthoniobacter sp.]|jgi:hypothetical protein|nr:hypothetical protein [Chthoniobacter sp.]
MTQTPAARAFTLAETVIAMASSVLIIGALLLGTMGLQKSLHASEAFASSQSDQRRLIDYLARDLRRCIGIGVTTGVSGAFTRLAAETVIIEDRTALVLTLPGYYKSDTPSKAEFDEALPAVKTDKGIGYGSGSGPAPGVSVTFRKVFLPEQGGYCFVREEAGTEQAIVRGAKDLQLQVGIATDGKTCAVEVWFRSAFGNLRPVISTHDQIMLRNLRID